jgi:hypothetical protein
VLGLGAGRYKKEVRKRLGEMDGGSGDAVGEELQGEEVGGCGDVGEGEGSAACATLYDLWMQ